MPSAQEVYNTDTEVSKRHVRSRSLFFSSPLCAGLLDQFCHNASYQKIFFRLPFIFAFSTIGIDESCYGSSFPFLFSGVGFTP